MRQTFLAALILASLCCGPSMAQEIAGRVLVVAGDMTIIRGGQRIAARAGTEVRTGDTLQVGQQSNAQVLLTDQSVFSLRPETTMKLSEYAFQDRPPETQRAIFDLVKGGMRTLSGLIGKVKPENYGVVTKTATIGIRGTLYGLVVCDNSCRGPDGAPAPNGTYGAVTDGRISVTNQTGETVFGANQFFTVTAQNAKPDQLIAPPLFLRDSLEGRAKAKKSSVEKAETQAATSPVGDTRITSTVAASTLPPTLAPELSPTQTAAATQGAAAVLQSIATGTLFYRVTGVTVPELTCGTSPCGSVQVDAVVLGINLGLQRAAVFVNFRDSSNKAFNLGSPALAGSDGIPVTVSDGQLKFSQTFLLSDYPQNQGAFRCQGCGPGNTVGFLDSMTVTGVVSGTDARLTLAGTDAGGGGSFAVDLKQIAPPTNLSAAAVIPIVAGGAFATSQTYFGINVNSAGMLTGIGPASGANRASVGTGSNTMNGSDAAAGNLVWGHWFGTGAQMPITDFNYQSYPSASTAVVPWITGTAINTVPASLGTQTYAKIGGFVYGGGGIGTLNSANLMADFVNRHVQVSINATNGPGTATFQMNGSTGVSAITGRFGAAFTSVSCSGVCPAASNGNYNGFFSGANAEGAGIAFAAGGGSNGVIGVAGLKR